jgi:hypothetical protein
MTEIFQYDFMINDTSREEKLSDLRFLESKTSCGDFVYEKFLQKITLMGAFI